MWTLGIETSGLAGALALLRDDAVVAERVMSESGRRHAQALVAELHQLLAEAGCRATDLELIAVSRGPGSFTGLRVGCTVAKTLCYATGAQLAAVDTFAVIAHAAPTDLSAVYVVDDAQRQEFFVGEYRRHAEGWEPSGPVTIAPAREWLSGLGEEEVVMGPGLRRAKEPVSRARLLTGSPYERATAGATAELGLARYRRQGPDDLWTLEPFYIRPSAAEEKRAAGS